jgi:CRP/FNR family cyclic AMP-dependent transcriptional regulator
MTLSPKLRSLIADNVQILEMQDGDVVHRTGDEPEGFYGVISGQVRITMNFENGQVLLIHVADPGAWFGEASTLDKRPRFNDAVCVGPTRLARLSQAAADKLLRQEPDFIAAVAVLCCRHYRSTMAFTARALTQPVSAQIAYALLSLVRRSPEVAYPMTLPLRQEDLANIVGVSRQTVAPLLKTFQASGIIELGYGSITVLDEVALTAQARRYNS